MCAQVLAQDGGNAKALFRRGRAHAALGRSEEALRDLQAAAQAAPGGQGHPEGDCRRQGGHEERAGGAGAAERHMPLLHAA